MTVERTGAVSADLGADVESMVVAAFRDVLGDGEPVDAGSDFFDLGGNSILGARLVARLRQVLEVKVTIRDLFRARTAGVLAGAVRQRMAARGQGRDADGQGRGAAAGPRHRTAEV